MCCVGIFIGCFLLKVKGVQTWKISCSLSNVCGILPHEVGVAHYVSWMLVVVKRMHLYVVVPVVPYRPPASSTGVVPRGRAPKVLTEGGRGRRLVVIVVTGVLVMMVGVWVVTATGNGKGAAAAPSPSANKHLL